MEIEQIFDPRDAALRLFQSGRLEFVMERIALALGSWNGEAGKRVAIDESILEELAAPDEYALGTAALTFFAMQYNLKKVPGETGPESHVYLNRRKKHIESVATGYGRELVIDITKTFDLSKGIGDAIDLLANLSEMMHHDYTARVIELDMMTKSPSGMTNLERYGYRLYSIVVQHMAENIASISEPNRYCADIIRNNGNKYHRGDREEKEKILRELATKTRQKPNWFKKAF